MGTRARVIPAAFARVLAVTSADDALCPARAAWHSARLTEGPPEAPSCAGSCVSGRALVLCWSGLTGGA